MVECHASDLIARVRFPPPAPTTFLFKLIEHIKNHSTEDEQHPSIHVTDFLDNQISDNEEKIYHYKHNLKLVPKCRWLLYFG